MTQAGGEAAPVVSAGAHGAGAGSAGPLAGVRVLDMSRILAGPYAAMQLGDLGADVIKVEPPGGDDSRHWGPPWVGGEGAYYLGVNRNKRSIALDLKRAEAREVIKRLAAGSDILIENFRTGTMEGWGLGYDEVLRPLNPGLVYCSITGYGTTGPSAHLPGYDPIIEAVSGLMSITGEPDGRPMKVGVAVIDMMTGCQVAYGVVAALVHRLRTGEGQRVELSLLETSLSSLANQASAFLISGRVPARHGNAHPAIVPYQTFRTARGEVMVCVGNDRQFRAFCRIIGHEEMGHDERFVTNPLRVKNRVELLALLDEVLAGFDPDELTTLAEAAGVPVAPVNDLEQAFAHPQVAARQMVIEIDHPTAGTIRQVGFPVKMDRTPASIRHAPPRHGEHTAAILAELGYGPEEIEAWLSTPMPS